MKSPNLRHRQACTQNKGLNRTSRLQTIPLRWQAARAGRGAIAAPQRHYPPNCKQASLLTKTSWGSGRSTSAWEGTPVVHPENQATGMGEAISRSDHARQTPHHLSCSNLWKAQNAGPTQSAPLRTTRVPESEQLRPGRCMQPRAGLRRFQRSNLEPELCGQGACTCHERGQAQCGWDTASTRQCYLFEASLPPHSPTEQVSLKKCPPPPPCVRSEIRHWRDQQTEEAKTKGTAWEVTGAVD